MNKTTKTILGLVVLVLIIWAGFSYTQTLKVGSDEPIKIGLTTALTGNYADYGVNILKGVEEMVDEVNKNNYLHNKIELLIEDNQADIKSAVNAYKLFKMQGADIVLSSFSGITGALNPLSKEDKIILMYNAASPSFADENEYAFKVYSDVIKEANMITEQLKDAKEKLGIVFVSNSASELTVKELEKNLNISKYEFNIEENDFRTTILKLKEDNIEGVIILAYADQIVNFVKQVTELKYTPKFIFSTSDGVRKDVVSQISPLLKDTILYITAGYGTDNQDYIFGYDLAKILVDGLKRCDDVIKVRGDISECLKKELKNVEIEGKSGRIYMGGTNKAVVFPNLYTVTDGNIVLLK